MGNVDGSRSPRREREGDFEEDGKIIENFRSKRSKRLGGVLGIGSDVLAGRLVIKQRARAKYLHKSVLPCTATPEKKLILLLHDRAIARTNVSPAE